MSRHRNIRQMNYEEEYDDYYNEDDYYEEEEEEEEGEEEHVYDRSSSGTHLLPDVMKPAPLGDDVTDGARQSPASGGKAKAAASDFVSVSVEAGRTSSSRQAATSVGHVAGDSVGSVPSSSSETRTKTKYPDSSVENKRTFGSDNTSTICTQGFPLGTSSPAVSADRCRPPVEDTRGGFVNGSSSGSTGESAGDGLRSARLVIGRSSLASGTLEKSCLSSVLKEPDFANSSDDRCLGGIGSGVAVNTLSSLAASLGRVALTNTTALSPTRPQSDIDSGNKIISSSYCSAGISLGQRPPNRVKFSLKACSTNKCSGQAATRSLAELAANSKPFKISLPPTACRETSTQPQSSQNSVKQPPFPAVSRSTATDSSLSIDLSAALLEQRVVTAHVERSPATSAVPSTICSSDNFDRPVDGCNSGAVTGISAAAGLLIDSVSGRLSPDRPVQTPSLLGSCITACLAPPIAQYKSLLGSIITDIYSDCGDIEHFGFTTLSPEEVALMKQKKIVDKS